MTTRVAIINQKGGVTKTTTTFNLASALAIEFNQRVLALDLCAQGQLSAYVKMRVNDPRQDSPAYRVLARGCPVLEYVQKTDFAFDLLAGGPDTKQAELLIGSNPRGLLVLRQALDEIPPDTYDIILMDCPPSISHMSQTALVASSGYLVPLLMQGMSVDGFDLLLNTANDVATAYNPSLGCVGVLGANTKKESNHSNNIRGELQEKVSELMFAREIRYTEGIVKGFDANKPVVVLDPKGIGSEDYRATCVEFLARVAA